jgi:hypothetical protein
MRTDLGFALSCLQARWIGHMAIALAVVVSVAPAAFAQDSRNLDHCKSAGTETKADERQAQEESGSNTGIVVAVPIGRVCVGPDVVDGEPSYVRRTTDGKGITIVEVSTTPFMPVLASNEGTAGGVIRTDQPAGW